ncbi:MAG TPA: Ldh family oxidoreductase [bacterium]|nr:Ldh family oxidoreductase [bacterium]
MGDMEAIRFRVQDLQELAVRIFRAVETPADTAQIVASALVDANLAGHDSHGVIRIPDYVERIRRGDVRPMARPRVLAHRAATALVSGEWGFGQLAGLAAIDEAVTRVREYGVAAVGVVRCNHLGRVGSYVERAAAAGCVAGVWVGGFGRGRAVPHGGSRPALGTNPLAAGFPVHGEDPVVVDFATTAVAVGKIMVAHAAKKHLPPGSIIDERGRPTTDPADFLKGGGALLPFGGHKGYSLAVLAELLGLALTGADAYGTDGGGGDVFRHAGALFWAIDVGAFRPAEEAEAAAERIAGRLRAIPPAAGFDRVYTPGEPEARTRRQREQDGIALPGETWRAIVAAAESVGVSPASLPQAVEAPAGAGTEKRLSRMHRGAAGRRPRGRR